MLSPSRLGLNGPSRIAHNNGFRVRTAPYVCVRRATHNTPDVSFLSGLPSVTSNLARAKPAVPVIPGFVYSFGLHLIAGAQGSGKTTTSIALMALFLKLNGGMGLVVDLENRNDINSAHILASMAEVRVVTHLCCRSRVFFIDVTYTEFNTPFLQEGFAYSDVNARVKLWSLESRPSDPLAWVRNVLAKEVQRFSIVVIDSLGALGADVCNMKVMDELLAQLHQLAVSSNTAILLVHHVSKGGEERLEASGQPSITMVKGVKYITERPTVVMFVTPPDKHTGLQKLWCLKDNKAEKAPARAFRILPAEIDYYCDGQYSLITTSFAKWDSEPPELVNSAADFIRDYIYNRYGSIYSSQMFQLKLLIQCAFCVQH